MHVGRLHISYTVKRRIIVAIALILLGLLYAFKNTSFLSRSAATLGFLVVFYLFDHLFDLQYKAHHYAFIVFIAIASFLLSPLYYIYPIYDKVLHFLQPLLFCSIIFHAIDHIELKLKWKITFTFFVVMGLVGLFEIGEYLLDYFFDLKLQGVFLRNLQTLEKFDILIDRIDDTMIDMILGIIGALVYSVSRLPFIRHALEESKPFALYSLTPNRSAGIKLRASKRNRMSSPARNKRS